MKLITLLLAVLLAAISSSCVNVHGTGNTVNAGNINGGGGYGAMRPGRPSPPPRMAYANRGGGRQHYAPPQGFRPMKGCPPKCSVRTVGNHRFVCDPRGRRIGFLPPHVFHGGSYGHDGYEYVHGRRHSYGHGGFDWDGDGYSSGARYSHERPQPRPERPRHIPNMRDEWDTGPGNPRPLSVVTPNGSERIF